jgi:tRNA(Ile)-lysidine synthase
MGNSRRWSPAEPGASPSTDAASDATSVAAAVETALARDLRGAAHVAVALSGGRDSVALLDAAVALASRHALRISAIHVHHGLSQHADRWLRFCAELCERRGIGFTERRVEVVRASRKSVEAEARRARYAALAEVATAAGIDAILLAHHQDDQAETVLLQLLRGAGPAGLAAMPHARTDANGIVWSRPLLDVPRIAIDAYVRERGLAWVDDDSNADARYARNALRLRIAPALASLAPGYPATVARSAALQADAVALADDLAALDARAAFDGATLERAILSALPPHRARNVLRWFLRERGLPAPSAARLDAMYAQLAAARADARIRAPHAGMEIGVHHGRVVIHRAAPPPFECAWQGEPTLVLAHGTLEFLRARGRGIAATQALSNGIVVRSRRGGERMQTAANRPSRALKALMQEAGMAPWTRFAIPLVYCGDSLAAVPGIGIDPRFTAPVDGEGFELVWNER